MTTANGPGTFHEVSLTQRMFVLAWNPRRQRLTSRTQLGLVLNGAALQDLVETGFLVDDDGKARPAAARGAVPDGALQAEVYARILDSDRPRSWRHWIRKGSHKSVGPVHDEMVRQRLIRVDRRRVLLVPVSFIVLRNPRLRTEALRAAHDAVRPTHLIAQVPRADAATATLAHAGQFGTVWSGRGRRAVRGRIGELSAVLGPVPGALRKAVDSAKAAATGA